MNYETGLISTILWMYVSELPLKLSTAKEKKNHKYALRISEISQLIQQHYTENITLQELADAVHLSLSISF